MIVITGKYNEAIVYASDLDEKCRGQILCYLDHPLFANTKVRIMPDVHFGAEATVGFTATCNEYVAPAIIGVDIGCGVNAYNLGRSNVPFDKLDRYIRKRIPAGRNVNPEVHGMLESAYGYVSSNEVAFGEFRERVQKLAEKVATPVERAFAALGTLGGGNHFIEVDRDENHCRWLLIHSGSRNFGLQVATHHQNIARKRTGGNSPIKFLDGMAAQEYINDMTTAQLYARVNRALIGYQIACDFLKISHGEFEAVESVHNYIDFKHGIMRKGAISAQAGEPLVIPFSMADGAIIGVGKGNGEWNYSAPHGSGRKMSRSEAKRLSVDEYRRRMKDVWSSCVGEKTLDESPMAYKKVSNALDFVSETLEITNRLTPVYNFKADE